MSFEYLKIKAKSIINNIYGVTDSTQPTNSNNECTGIYNCNDIMYRPIYWIDGTLEDDYYVFYRNDKRICLNAIYEYMQNYSEEKFIAMSCDEVKKMKCEPHLTEGTINDLHIYIVDYIQSNNAATHQVVYCKNNRAYIFTICEEEQISEETLKGFNSMLDMTLCRI